MTGSPAAGRPRFSVVVPVFNKAPFIGDVLGALTTAVRAYGDAELIVVDHDSTDGGAEILAALDPAPDVSLIRPRGTIASARNQGAARATGTHVSFVDADCLVPPDYLDRLAGVFGAVCAEAVGCHVAPPPGSAWPVEVWYRVHASPEDGPRLWLPATALTVTRAAFESVGRFDDAKETHEDVEFCARLHAAGFRIWETHSITVTHLDNPATLGAFFTKEAWRARGAFDGRKAGGTDRPTVAMVCHLMLLAAGSGLALGGPGSAAVRAGAAVALASTVPLASVLLRTWRNNHLVRPMAALVLYQVYYLARLAALLRSVRLRG